EAAHVAEQNGDVGLAAVEEVGLPGEGLGQLANEELLEQGGGLEGGLLLLLSRQAIGNAAGQQVDEHRLELAASLGRPGRLASAFAVESADDIALGVEQRGSDDRIESEQAGGVGDGRLLWLLPDGPPIADEALQDVFAGTPGGGAVRRDTVGDADG